jgi:hypothetical protein
VRTGRRRSSEPAPKARLNDLAGQWCGKAVDYPEDGSSTDPVSIKLIVSEEDELKGFAYNDFVDIDEARLDDVYVVGDRLEFKVRHRTGVKMRVTLSLANNTLIGEGIPIRSDEDRCHIELKRQRPEPSSPRGNVNGELAGAERFDGRWVGVVTDKSKRLDFRRSLIVDISIDKHDGTIRVITMGGYQQAYDDHYEDVAIQNGKIAFPLTDCEGTPTAISLWPDGRNNRLVGQAVPPRDSDVSVRDIELRRADGPREYEWRNGLLRLVGEHRLPSAGASFRPSLSAKRLGRRQTTTERDGIDE